MLNQIDQIDQIDQINPINQINHINQINKSLFPIVSLTGKTYFQIFDAKVSKYIYSKSGYKKSK